MTEDQYYAFVGELATAELPHKELRGGHVLRGLPPRRDHSAPRPETLRFGPMKPVGLPDPRTDKVPFAVVQLRQDDAGGRLFNIVGFQTRLKWGEQRRVFRTIPGLENADFARMGVMHRNTYLPSNRMLEATMRIEASLAMRPSSSRDSSPASRATSSAAMGHIAGANAARLARGEAP